MYPILKTFCTFKAHIELPFKFLKTQIFTFSRNINIIYDVHNRDKLLFYITQLKTKCYIKDKNYNSRNKLNN